MCEELPCLPTPTSPTPTLPMWPGFLCSFFMSFFCFLLLWLPICPCCRFLCVWVFFLHLWLPLSLCAVVTTKFCGFLVYFFSVFLSGLFFLRFPVLHLQRVSNGKDLVEVISRKWENMKIPPYSYYLSHVSNDVFVVISLIVVTSDFRVSFLHYLNTFR